ncbi:MAG: sialate O-acetylesterase [Fusicatenibacter sp.]|nr:sialate O-acetylesterase [Fusicatenibacter sp.]
MTKSEKLQLPSLLGDGCVLLQGDRTRIWGKAVPGQRVTVDIQGKSFFCTAKEDGSFEVFASHLVPGGPEILTVTAESGEKLQVRDVWIGEVFLCSGQSNMELPMNRVKDRYPEEFQRAGDRRLRLYKVKERYCFQGSVHDHAEAGWIPFEPDQIGAFSAVSYFFARMLEKRRKVPVGVINVSLGGSPIEAWMGEEALKDFPDLMELLGKYKNDSFVQQKLESDARAEAAWQRELNQRDLGWTDAKQSWKPIFLPGFLRDQGLEGFSGCIYLRRRFLVPAAMAGEMASLWLGTMTDADTTYVNGQLAGETGYQYPPRKYQIPGGCLKEGVNEICIRLVVRRGQGRVTPGKKYEIFNPHGRIDLEGAWEYCIGCSMKEAPEQDFITWQPTGLYNGMLAPCHPYTIRGVLWYQGESNDKRPDTYEELLKRMIRFWREKWQQERLPFLIAQLPDFSIDLPKGDESWPKIREAERKAEQLPDVAVTVNLDLGEENDLHPLNKKEIAHRLELAAEGMIYGEDLIWRGPNLRGWSWKEEGILLEFETYDGKGLTTVDGGCPKEFEIAGSDGIYVPAGAIIEGSNVLVATTKVSMPAYLRYAWKNAPKGGLLCNHAFLLASPFCIELSDFKKNGENQDGK